MLQNTTFRNQNNIFFNETGETLFETLTRDYPYSLDAIKRDKYEIEFLQYDFFEEIHYKNIIIGFLTLKQFTVIENSFSINEVFILPRYRGKIHFIRY